MNGETTTTTFKQAYGVLQAHAETLRNQTEPNIDDLLAIVEESVSAYKVCKERIDAVEKALQRALADVGDEAGSSRAAGDEEGSAPRVKRAPARASAPAASPAAPKTGFDDMEDDIPF